jgi:Protein of unknown function (DUF4089)
VSQKNKRTARFKASRRRSHTTKNQSPAKPVGADIIDALINASASALNLPLDPSWHAAIKFNLQLILRHASVVDEFPLPDYLAPGPIFHA